MRLSASPPLPSRCVISIPFGAPSRRLPCRRKSAFSVRSSPGSAFASRKDASRRTWPRHCCPLTPSHARTPVLTADQARSIIRSEPHPRNQLLLEVLYAGALTVTETATLQCKDLHVGEYQLRVTLHGPHARTVTFRLSRQSLAGLRDLVKTQNESSPVFLSQPQIHRILHAAAERVALGRSLSPATFRHAAVSHLLEQGVTLLELQHLLGHRSPATTSRFLFITTRASAE